MKKTLNLIFAITWLALFVFFIISIFNRSGVTSPNDEKSSSEYGYIFTDRPLIEYYFDTQDEWECIIYDDVHGDAPKTYVNSNKESLEFYKEKLVVNTFPVGRGTTETHVIVLSKNGEVEKTIYCHDYTFESEGLKGDFAEVDNASITINPINNLTISEADALTMAEDTWLSVYGSKIYKHMPFVATYDEKEKTWFVRGSLQEIRFGGVPEIEIDAVTGEILKVSHGK